MTPEEAGRAGAERRGVRIRRIKAKSEDRAYHGNIPIDAIGASTKGAKRMIAPPAIINLTAERECRTLSNMEARTSGLGIRVTRREKEKIRECAALMGVGESEFVRRCVQVMLMVMGDQESKSAIHQMIDAATNTMVKMKVGAGLGTRTPQTAGATGTPPSTKKGRKVRESGTI